jgi:hypothetical protein
MPLVSNPRRPPYNPHNDRRRGGSVQRGLSADMPPRLPQPRPHRRINAIRYPSNMIADFSLLMPKSVKDKFFEIMDEEEKSIERIRQCYLDMAIEMKTALAEIDKKIEELVGK